MEEIKINDIWVTKIDPKKLLYLFWQRSSDACPLECCEAEKEEAEFEEWVMKHFVYLKGV